MESHLWPRALDTFDSATWLAILFPLIIAVVIVLFIIVPIAFCCACRSSRRRDAAPEERAVVRMGAADGEAFRARNAPLQDRVRRYAADVQQAYESSVGGRLDLESGTESGHDRYTDAPLEYLCRAGQPFISAERSALDRLRRYARDVQRGYESSMSLERLPEHHGEEERNPEDLDPPPEYTDHPPQYVRDGSKDRRSRAHSEMRTGVERRV